MALRRYMKHPCLRFPAGRFIPVLGVIAVAVLALYGHFLSSPLIFDDFSYFGENIADDLNLRAISVFVVRGLPVASFAWIRALAGADDIVWQRLGNLSLHIANCGLLFLFLRRLFDATLVPATASRRVDSARPTLAPPWLAFFGALYFALNPVAVYGVAYLAQRSTLMATLFALTTWMLFLEGLLRSQRRWLLASCASYLLAVLSKEHAIMVPAVALALLLLVRKPDRQLLYLTSPAFFLYGLTGAYIYFQIKSGGVVGRAYEPNSVNLLTELNVNPQKSHALSVLTQGFLYFKYLLLWIVPNPGWMSVDMQERFARSLWSLPETPAFVAFLLYPVVALRFLLRRGYQGLLGFSMLAPWLLFATELSTVRIQETFVLYRSYLWMPCLLAALPFLLQRVAARQSFILLAVVSLAMLPASWNRLSTFSDPVRLWDDALRLTKGKEQSSRLGRIHHNRGVAYSNIQRYQEAIQDFDLGIRYSPGNDLIYNDRAVAYLKTGRYQEALRDYNRAIRLNPNEYKPYLGRAQVNEALGNSDEARLDYARSCQLGVEEVCHLTGR